MLVKLGRSGIEHLLLLPLLKRALNLPNLIQTEMDCGINRQTVALLIPSFICSTQQEWSNEQLNYIGNVTEEMAWLL